MIRPDDLVPHMRSVQAAERDLRDLRDLGIVWQMIESSSAISCPEEVAPILPPLEQARERFDALRQRLTEQMVVENKDELGDELGAKAQCAIDILVRNLYERTADVGFLATDDVVRAFCAATERPPELRAAMQERLAEYQAKYTVYDDVILLSPQGEVLARLDGAAGLAHSRDPLVAEALAAGSYVERFRSSDLGNSGDAAATLLYAHRIVGGEGATAHRAVGVLVLRFRFADEMQRIFESINEDNPQLALVLVDDAQRVVATNDAAHVPTGALMARMPGNAIALTAFAGREYLAVCRASAGYQGYRGPAWRAQAMVSLLTAFHQRGAADEPAAAAADPAEADSVPMDNSALAALNRDADAINRELRRVVWNGRLMAGEHAGDRLRLKAVLKQINQAGLRTRARVAEAIQSIYRTSMARAARQARELARLAADIMDRNLYERANDCRWWALSPVLRQGLAEPAAGRDDADLARVLDHINGLYTVYSRLVVFDMQGTMRAVSRHDAAPELVGSAVPPAWQQAVAALADSQRYAVTPFEPTGLHEQGATYVYLAAVRAPGAASGRDGLVGGIAIVFNAAAELAAMLRDVLADRQGVAAFVDAQGQVLAATDRELAAALAKALPAAGAGSTRVAEHAGTHYALTHVGTGGYREFKAGDGYDNGVRALVALRLGSSERRRSAFSDVDLSAAAAGCGTGGRAGAGGPGRPVMRCPPPTCWNPSANRAWCARPAPPLRTPRWA